MRMHNAVAVLALLAMPLAACSGMGGLKDAPPPAYSLSGTWKLDPAHSTDTHAVLDRLTHARERPPAPEPMDSGMSPGGGRSRGPGPSQQGMGDSTRLPPLVEPVLPDIGLQLAELRGGEWLRIEQKPTELMIANALGSRSFTPGQRSVVSVPSGVADQQSGWKGKEFRIQLHPQEGPRVVETYRLSDDGRHLLQTIDIAADGRLPAVKVNRQYDPTQQPPGSLPSGD